MFTGIVKGLCKITSIEKFTDLLHYAVDLPDSLLQDLEQGASISVDGVCQTVVEIKKNSVFFDAIPETLSKTTLSSLEEGQFVNIERSAKFGDEIGGHLLSGHIYGTLIIQEIQKSENHQINIFACPKIWMKYFFEKGYVAVDGVSLTLVDVDENLNTLSVHLIPETLRLTTLGRKKEGDRVNIELDSQTQIIVETIERILTKEKKAPREIP